MTRQNFRSGAVWAALAAAALLAGCVSLGGAPGAGGAARRVFRSERKARLLPKTYDVAVVGGNFRSVVAAVEAARAGASVYLVAPRPNLGDDVADMLALDALTEAPGWDGVARELLASTNALPYHHRAIRENKGPPFASVSPIYVKIWLDQLLLTNRVDFMTSSMTTEIRHGDGVHQVVFANRSGWNMVRARAVVDCSDDVRFAEGAAVNIAPFSPGKHRFFYYVMSAEKPAGFADGNIREFANRYWALGTSLLYRCEAEFDLRDDSPMSLAEVAMRFRDRLFTRLEVDRGERMGRVAPLRTVADQASLDAAASHGYFLCNPAAGRFILTPEEQASGYALKLNAAATRLGRRAADFAARGAGKAPAAAGRETPAVPPAAPLAAGLEVREIALPDATVTLDATSEELPVIAETEVLVVGGGTTGSPAAIAAARAGARTLVVDYHYNLGGMQTTGVLANYWQGNRVGFTKEIDAGAAALGKVLRQTKGEYYRREILAAGGRILLGTMATGAVLADGTDAAGRRRIRGVSVITPDGRRGVILADVVIDSTGNADVAAAAGAPCVFGGSDETIVLQGTSMNWRDLTDSVRNSEVTYVDDRDADSIHQALLQARRSYGMYRWDQAPYIGSRERRSILGDFVVPVHDIARHATYRDTITICNAGQDSHGVFSDKMLFFTTISGATHYAAPIPYRALLPAGVAQLLVTGLGKSAHRDALSIMRMQADLQNEGYAAGRAAAMAAKARRNVADINIRKLQRHLVKKQILPPETLRQEDTPPPTREMLVALLPSVVAATNTNLDGIWDFYAAEPGVAKAVLEPAIASVKNRKSAEAVHLALLAGAFGIATGGDILVNYLIEPVDVPLPKPKGKEKEPTVYERRLWDMGYVSRICYGRRNSYKDQAIIALAFSKHRGLAKHLPAMLAALPDDPEFSHLRAVAIYLDAVPVPEAAHDLARILGKIKGKAQQVVPQDFPGLQTKVDGMHGPVKELLVARALYKLGDKDGLAKRVLESYLGEPTKMYANFARRVLTTGD